MLHAFNIQGLHLSKNNYYNLSCSEDAYIRKKACPFALGILKKQCFHLKYFEKTILKKNQVQYQVIKRFFFYNSKQI